MTPDDDLIAGNYYNKYTTPNPIMRLMVRGFLSAIGRLADETGADDIHEVGCGEGYVAAYLARRRSCRAGHAARQAWRRFCRCCICVAYRQATFKKRCPPFLARMRPICRRR